MDVEIPPSLQWVSYLAGGKWPQGSETGMGRIQEFLLAAADELDDLIPELNRVRGETLSVLMGETAQAANEQFAMLFDGDYAVDKLSDGMRALGESSGYTGSEIEYSKLSILVGLALAAAEITYALAMAGPTWGASTAAIPAIEWATATSIRQLISLLLQRLAAKVRDMLARTTVRRLVHEGFQEAGQELAIAGTQEATVYKLQGGNYNVNGERLLLNGIASTVGGGAGGVTAVPTANFLGPAGSRLGAASKGATTFFTAGVMGNIAGTASVGGQFDPFMIMVSSSTSSVGGLGGAGVAPGRGGNTSNGEPTGTQPPDTGSAPDGDLPPGGPQDDDSGTAESDRDTSSVNGSNNNGQDSNSVDGARVAEASNGQTANVSDDAPVADPPAAQHAPETTQTVKDDAAQNDPSATTAEPTTDHESEADDANLTERPSENPADEGELATQSSDDATLDGADTGSDVPGPDTTVGSPVTDGTPPLSENGHVATDAHLDTGPLSVTDADPESTMSTISAHAPVIDPASQPPVDSTAAASNVGTPPIHAQAPPPPPPPPPTATAPHDTSTSGTSVRTPPQTARPQQSPSQVRDQPVSDQPAKGGDQPARQADQPAPDDAFAAGPTAAASVSQPAVTPVAGVSNTAAAPADSSTEQTETDDDGSGQLSDGDPSQAAVNQPAPDCMDRVAEALSARYGRPIRLAELPSRTGRHASVLFQAVGSGADFATYDQVAAALGQMDPGSSAIVTSAWAGGPRQGGHTYLAVNDGGSLYLEDPFTGERSPWPPGWGQGAVTRSAVGYLDDSGDAVQPLQDTRQLVAAAAVGPVQGHPAQGDDSPDGDHAPGDRWRDVVPQNMVADSALAQRIPPVQSAEELRSPLGLMEAASARARDNANWWAGLTGAEQRALIDTYPHHIGNAEGIPAAARHEANTRALDQDRRELQARRERGERLTRAQRKQLARLDRIQEQLATASDKARTANVGGPLLLAFDALSFGGDGRAVVSFGADPYKAESVSWHVPGLKMNIDQLGPCMGDALNHLQSTLQENPDLKAASIAWIGYDAPSNVVRAAGHTMAREGATILYSDIRAFNAARDTWASDGSHFSGNHIFAHSYGSTTASYAGRDGRLANDIRTVTLIGSPGAGPVQRASEFGSNVDVYVASSSRDPIAGLGTRIFGSAGRIFGINLGIDPAMDSFGAQRITAEFSAETDRRRSWGTHLAYYKFVDRTADPPVRTESLANFGRIAAGHPDRLDFEPHRTVEDRALRRPHVRTVEPAAGRPLRHEGDTAQSVDRQTRRLWNPRWRAQPTAVEPSHVDDGAMSPDESQAVAPDDIATPSDLDPEIAREIANQALAERGIQADDLMSPADHRVAVQDAVARAQSNGQWWKGLSGTQQQALIQAYPHQVGNAEGIPPLARHEANSLMLQRYLAHRDLLVSRRDNGVALKAADERFIDMMNDIESALRSAERNAHRAQVGGPYLLALDPRAFGGAGRAIVSFGADPYTAKSVSWYVPGMTTTIEKMRAMMLRGFNQLQSTLRESPDLKAASITYIGYKAPGSWDPRVTSQKMAREGGQIFCSDIQSFNAGRDVFAGDGSHFSNNHVFAHSYGSTTVSHAGHGRRLAGQVQTITLIGSPGAGPLQHASDFAIGDNVFVAASSRDRTTGLGGERAGDRGRLVRRVGQGVDPAMDFFGARRITAEFPAALDHTGRGSRMTHSLYWAYMDPGANPRVRSESLVNFGRIAAGHADRVDIEGHRTLGERRRLLRRQPGEGTVEPAIGRPLRLVDDATTQHAVDRRNYWNPRFRNVPAEAIEPASVDVGDGSVDDGAPSQVELPAADVEQVPVSAKVVADVALAERGIQADDLMSPVDHRVPAYQAVARAEVNGQWWKGLSEAQQQALIQAYPHQVGNAEGIPPMARHKANSLMLQQYLAHRDVLVSRRDNGVALNAKQEQFIDLMNNVEAALRSAEQNAHRAQVGGPYLLALDPRAFGGAGRAIVSFGEDPYTADSVSWYVPGMTTTIEKMRAMMLRGFNQLQSMLEENPGLKAASITYIGYKAPGSWDPRVTSQRMAREGGQIFCNDMLSFNAGRDIFTGDGSHFSNNHVFAHSYGSTTVSHAGHGRRLAGQVQTITLIGSPGAGPIQHASEFGIGDNVFVAASSRDRTTGLGGERPGDRGRLVRRVGQGIDPAMDSFGARRITAEFPAALDHTGRGSRMTHSLYWAYMDPGTTQVRSEALVNFGRIAAGHADRVDIEGHRTLGERPRLLRKPGEATIDPAIGRPLRLADDPTTHHAVNRRNYWNPGFLRDSNCAHVVAEELSAMYGRDIRLAIGASSRGVPAWMLFEAVGSSSRFATYAEVAETLRNMPSGSSAMLASRWRGRGQAGHAYLAINDGGTIYLFDPHSGQRSGWPPRWGQDAVSRTAVGYLDANGDPIDPHDGSTRQLAAAGSIGRVQGHPGTSAVADEALAQRVPPVLASGLVNPLGSAELAAERAHANAAWWAGLSETQRQALIETHPLRIGNAEGIPAVYRDTANRHVLQQYREHADRVQTKIDEFVLPSQEERNFLKRVNRIEAALRKADADAARAGLDCPLLLAFDPAAFGGDGRAVISFGDDPYTAEKVSWHTGRQPIDKLGPVVRPALDQLQSGRQESQSEAVIVWVGDNRATAALHSDLAAFHAAREAFATTGEATPFTGNRVHTLSSPSTSHWVSSDAGSLVVAHRGASHEFPEQTLAAYEEALRQGARGLECDVRLTKDGHLVCIHDKRVDRTSDGTGLVGDMTLAELQALDYGGWHPSRQLGDAQGDTGILTLEQLLQLVANHDQPVTLFIETKHPDKGGWKLEREVVALLERYGMANPASPDQARAAVISFYPDALWRVRRAAPNLPTVLLGATAPYLATTVGATGIGPSIEMLRSNPELVDSAAARGMTTYCWTVNDRNDVQYARDLGVGWIATDHPGRTDTWIGGDSTETIDVTTEPASNDAPVPPDPDATRTAAEAALAQRVPPVRPDELRNPLGVMEEAVARAQNNATWWAGLTGDQRQALIETYPQHFGNAEGILAADRDAANRRVLQQLRDQADQVQSKIDDGKRPSPAERKLLQRVNRLAEALRKASADAERAGESGPLLLAFDPAEFGGDGRAVLSFGDDPYQADSVSWHAPGIRTTIDSLFGFSARSALNHLQSTRFENPSLTAASIAWIGYDTPSGRGLGRMSRQTLARAGGDILYSDIRAFNAGRDAWAGDGSHFTGNHIFGYSYGSTTTAHAGRDGRLASHVTTVSLVGSPGAGPLQHASEFGQGVDVYVASSSRDVVTAQGGRTTGSVSRFLAPVGRFFGIGLGVDPAMESFGAVRVTAEFPAARNLPYTGGTHHAYLLHMDTTAGARSDSLANLGRISAGRAELLELEQHRTTEGRHTVEPAAERAGPQRFWNPRWSRIPNCAQLVANELSAMYGRDFHLDVRPSRRGVQARALFEAIGSDAEFATYNDVAEALQHMPSGSTAVLVSRWSGGRQGGHAYLARNIDGDIYLIDPRTGKTSGWPPHWGQGAVARTAVGYLNANGDPVDRVNIDIPLRLDAADAVGRVQGLPADADFQRRQAEYRAQDPATRRVDTRYAEPLGDVVDNLDEGRVRRLAQDLSGVYGPYRVELTGSLVGREVFLDGAIISGDEQIGTIQRRFDRDTQGNLVAYHTGLVIKSEYQHLRGQGFSKAFGTETARYYIRSGVDRIESHTHDKGAYALARRGDSWDPDPRRLHDSLNAIKDAARRLRHTFSKDAQIVLDDIVQRLEPDHPRLPEPIDIADLATPDEPLLGQRLLHGVGLRKDGTGVDFVKYMPVAGEVTAPSRSGFRGLLQRWFGFGGDSQGLPRDNCALVVADELSAMYGREIRVVARPSRMGAAARELFMAVGSSSRFATYAEVAETLRDMPSGSSAVLASRWAHGGGRHGGHAYLAINDGGDIYLFDPHTGKRSGWPPHWGQDAVTRTAVGYLDANGNPVHPLHDVPLQLAAANTIGHVQGHPEGMDPSTGGLPDPVRALGLPNYAPGTLSDAEASTVYSHGELRMRDLNERLIHDGVSTADRARVLSDLRSALRSWTRELMSNRVAAEFLAANESNPTFEDLVARNEAKGLVGDAIYQAVIDSATHSHYARGTLSNAETRTVYTTFELQMREVGEQLIRDGAGLQERARTLYELRASLRTWTRSLMEDRETAEHLTANEPNPSFEDLVARQRAKGRVGDEIYEAIIASATRSRPSVNESLGIDPENPPPLPPMRGVTGND